MDRIALPSKPDAELAYTLHSTPSGQQDRPSSHPRLIVFLNNLLMPAASWETPIANLNAARARTVPQAKSRIPILTYDRFGQGATTARDPLDARPGAEEGYGHDFLDVVHDLHELIQAVLAKHFPTPEAGLQVQPTLLVVGASIGAPLARLYAETYPGVVEGLILLDSNIANVDYSTFWPDPAAPDFDAAQVVANDCTLEQYVSATKALAGMFDRAVKNRESLDRRNLPDLLPKTDAPVLQGPEGKRTRVVVVGHDPEAFAEEGLQRMKTPKSITTRWTQPYVSLVVKILRISWRLLRCRGR